MLIFLPLTVERMRRFLTTNTKMIIRSIDQKSTVKLLTKEQRRAKEKKVQKATENVMFVTSEDHSYVLEVQSDPDDDDSEKSLSIYQKVSIEKKIEHAASTYNETIINLSEEVPSPSTSNVQMRTTLSTLARECDRTTDLIEPWPKSLLRFFNRFKFDIDEERQ